jgi:hypothetical protein
MVELVNLNDQRKKKAEKCDWCGAPEHIATFACPRVCAVTYDGDAVTVELWPIDEPPKDAA